MENKNKLDYNVLLERYFNNDLPPEEKQLIENWKNISNENLIIFNEAKKVWQAIERLKEMKHYNASLALTKVNSKIAKLQKGILFYLQKAAAILIIPIIIAFGYYYITKEYHAQNETWQTINTPPGVKSQITLADGTQVWLNSKTTLRFPYRFEGNKREVELSGEACFEVKKDMKHPFIVNMGEIGVKVVGTRFDAANYMDEDLIQVTLETGKVKIIDHDKKSYDMSPGQMAIYNKGKNDINISNVDAEKYLSWTKGILVFRDDTMTEVVQRLNRWYDAKIEIKDKEIESYVYTATIQNETLLQVLELLKKSSPIDYKIYPDKKQDKNSFNKNRIVLYKK